MNTGPAPRQIAAMINPETNSAAVHNLLVEHSLFHEAFIGCSDGHCLFDSDLNLVSWSDSFGQFYSPIINNISVGYNYIEFLRDLVEFRVLRNLELVEDIDTWLEQQKAHLERESGEFIHHLPDNRIMLIKYVRLSNQSLLFAATNITELRTQKEELANNKNKFRAFAQLSSDWFWELDENLCYRYHSTHNDPIGFEPQTKMIGKQRIHHVEKYADNDHQLQQHHDCLRARKPVDVILTWRLDKFESQPSLESDSLTVMHTHIQAKPIYDRHGVFTGYIGSGKDVTDSYRMAQELEHQASHDDLTGLLNRRAFTETLDSLLSQTFENKKAAIKTLVFVDLDQFKLVNDGGGHQAGDHFLQQITPIFKNSFETTAIIARLGGDEFGIILNGRADVALVQVNQLIRELANYRLHWANRSFTIGASAGLVEIDHTQHESSEVLSFADIACYGAKVSGRNQAQLYSDKNPFHRQQNEELSTVKLLNDCLNNNGLKLFLQPQIATANHQLPLKYEVLLRILDNGTLIPPGALIPVAEKYDRMQKIDLWVVENSIRQLQAFHAAGIDCTFSVNLSGNTLSDESTLDGIAKLVEDSEIKFFSLCFEITETAAIKGIDKAKTFISRLKKLGCEFSLDDFGAGLSSFSYLSSLEVDYLKIDGSFVKNIETDPTSSAIVKSFNTLGHEMGMKTVAEFVENLAIADLLTEMGIDYLQGYGVGKPRAIEEFFSELAPMQKATG